MTAPRYTGKEIAAAFPPVAKGKKASSKPQPSSGRTETLIEAHPILGIFRAMGMQVGRAKDMGDGTGYATSCPFYLDHTDAATGPSEALLTIWPDGEIRHWRCSHSHCHHRGLEDVLALAKSRDLVVPDSRKRPNLPRILVCPPEIEVADAGRQALSNHPGVYGRRGTLVHVSRHPGSQGKRCIPAGSVIIKNAVPAWVREQLSKCAVFERSIKSKEGFEKVPSMVPEWVASMVLEAPGPGFPELRAVVTTPVFLADGSIHAAYGELRDGCLYLGPTNLPAVPEHPTEADARSAWNRLQQLWVDFPFASAPSPKAHQAALLAATATVAGRYAFEGPSPWVLLEANAQASGKGLLSQIVSIITTGQMPPVMSCSRDEVELKKGILPVLVDGTRLQVLDEIHPGFGGKAWNAMVTAPAYKDRILGTSQTVEVPNDTVWFCTGNNVGLAPDTTRRCLAIRLEPMEEHPEDRTDFKIPDLLAFVRQHQPELLRDVLTILRAFHCAGRPASGLKPWGSFEGWSRLIRDATYWVTRENPDCRQALALVADMGRIVHADLVAELHAAFENAPFTTGSVIEKAVIKPDLRTALEAACPSKDGKLHAVSIGKRFASFRRRPVDGRMLDQAPTDDRKGGALWCIRGLDAIPLRSNASDGWRTA